MAYRNQGSQHPFSGRRYLGVHLSQLVRNEVTAINDLEALISMQAGVSSHAEGDKASTRQLVGA